MQITKTMKSTALILVFLLTPLADFSAGGENRGEKKSQGSTGMNACLDKYDSQWGLKCTNCPESENTYRVSYRNICTDKIDVQICVQETSKKWKMISYRGVPPQDTLSAAACNGTGKSLFWVKKAGDREVVFPTIDQINKDYSK